MIIVRLTGGLGNQLFQYAFGRRQAHVGGAELKLDISYYAANYMDGRQYRLNNFNVVEDIASVVETASLAGRQHHSLIGRLERALRSRLHMHKKSIVREHGCVFSPMALKKTDNVYLDGYWQSEKYFKDIEDILRSEFTVRNPQDQINRSISADIDQTESVSLHIRRGDYVSNAAFNKVHGVCAPDYYESAIERLMDEVKAPRFFVFSDDIEWCRDNLKLKYPITFIDHNGEDRDYEDLRLMSRCKHHIIANSSFSWWGAWLSSNSGKIVIAPAKWFNDPHKDSKDIVPDSWQRI
ncbi:alpha-1,2-fucosyltransferase [bacterium]|nr:alpha-1,2-fucosyltransferase [bacterium]